MRIKEKDGDVLYSQDIQGKDQNWKEEMKQK